MQINDTLGTYVIYQIIALDENYIRILREGEDGRGCVKCWEVRVGEAVWMQIAYTNVKGINESLFGEMSNFNKQQIQMVQVVRSRLYH